MTVLWVLAALAAWCVASLPVALLVGRSLARADDDRTPAEVVELDRAA